MNENILQKLVEQCEFNPNGIGVAILKELGYIVEEYSNTYGHSVYVWENEKREKLLYSK